MSTFVVIEGGGEINNFKSLRNIKTNPNAFQSNDASLKLSPQMLTFSPQMLTYYDA
jgi:hypothetical protein